MKQSMCEQTMDKFLELDKNENLGLKVSFHLLTCKKCRTLVRLCSVAQRSSARPLYVPESISNNVETIIQKANPSIDLLKDSHVKPVTLKWWLFSGILILASFLMFALFGQTSVNEAIEAIIYTVFAIIICIYTAFFVGSNLDLFTKIIDNYKN